MDVLRGVGRGNEDASEPCLVVLEQSAAKDIVDLFFPDELQRKLQERRERHQAKTQAHQYSHHHMSRIDSNSSINNNSHRHHHHHHSSSLSNNNSSTSHLYVQPYTLATENTK